MRAVYFFIITCVLISLSCSSSKQTSNTENSIQVNNTQAVDSSSSCAIVNNNWSKQSNSNSSKIKILNAAIAFGSLSNGLSQMGYSVTENTGTSLTTNTIRAISDDVRVKAWIEGSDIVLTSEVQEYTETEFGLPQPSGFTICNKGSSSSFPDCWRTILVIANHLGGEKRFQ
jgi:hypothetical protein